MRLLFTALIKFVIDHHSLIKNVHEKPNLLIEFVTYEFKVSVPPVEIVDDTVREKHATELNKEERRRLRRLARDKPRSVVYFI